MVAARFLLDTNAVSEALKPVPNARFRRHLALHQGSLGVPAPAWHELLYGLFRLPSGAKKRMIEAGLRGTIEPSVEILAYDEAAAGWHATERARLEALGRPAPFVDGQIAAIAAVNRIPLVTRNGADFEPFSGVLVADWWAEGD